jgi:hypothetical protein
MPTASDELRDLMGKMFGDRISDAGPMKFLTTAGYKLTRGWEWEPKPGVTGYNGMTQDEYACLLFLVKEWDFGGLVGDKK